MAINYLQAYLGRLEKKKEWWTWEEAFHWALAHPGTPVFCYDWRGKRVIGNASVNGTDITGFTSPILIMGRFKNPEWNPPENALIWGQAYDRVRRGESLWFYDEDDNPVEIKFAGDCNGSTYALAAMFNAGYVFFASNPEEKQR